jgi:hypothetical protein
LAPIYQIGYLAYLTFEALITHDQILGNRALDDLAAWHRRDKIEQATAYSTGSETFFKRNVEASVSFLRGFVADSLRLRSKNLESRAARGRCGLYVSAAHPRDAAPRAKSMAKQIACLTYCVRVAPYGETSNERRLETALC